MPVATADQRNSCKSRAFERPCATPADPHARPILPNAWWISINRVPENRMSAAVYSQVGYF